MADPLLWKPDQGFDIHVLRTGPASLPLTGSFNIDAQFPLAQFPLSFEASFKGAPSNHGVTVNTQTGTVKAVAHPNASQPKLRNFLMTARQVIPPASGGQTFETKVRVHVHDSVQKIWLTPNTLTIHTRVDECKFTVLALFDDGSTGDITEWPQLTFKSADTTAVDLLPGGVLSAQSGRTATEMDVEITVTLKLATPTTNQSATAIAATRSNWTSVAEREVKVEFVEGGVAPNQDDLSSAKPNSVASVVANRTNILFVSEGFTQTQDQDFNAAVDAIVKKAFRKDILQPFKLLKGSINYWRVFVKSREDGISLLGEYERAGTSARHTAMPLLDPPAAGATTWSLANMMHELGEPVPQDPVKSLTNQVADWKQLYTAPVTNALVAASFADWNALRTRTPLNERDSVFGIANSDRPRASMPGAGDAKLGASLRRASEASIDEFIGKLVFGVAPPNGDPFNIGETWTNAQKDRGLVCFICLSDLGPGEARPGYFAAATGVERLVTTAAAPPGGQDIKTSALSAPGAPYIEEVLASRVAHECAHAFGLGDEYGPGSGVTMSNATVSPPIYPNLQTKTMVVSAAGAIDPTLIKWLLPRVFKVMRVIVAPIPQGGSDFQMRFDPAVPHPFIVDDPVLIRQAPLDKNDPYLPLRFKVVQKFANAVDVRQVLGPPLDPSQFLASKYVLIGFKRQQNGTEVSVVGTSVLAQIAQANSPLNAPAGTQGAVCVPASNAQPFMLPTNLFVPLQFTRKAPPSMADVLGVYEGGGHFDCDVYRPAGRCKMRTADDKTIPFCHVCRYIIVDRVEAAKLAELDRLYEPFYPL